MPKVEAKSIHLPTYLAVLSQLPDVTEEQSTQAAKTLRDIFGKNFDQEMVFSRGLWKGDGKIQVRVDYRSES